ncbi:MAG: hypothetical protein H8E20_15350 [Verrucomicrobia bacterium]|nr:hypothetical protein [Verrucomicrobiota bacterium]
MTVRGLGKDLVREIHQTARDNGISLNKAALLLMRQGAGLSEDGTGAVAASLAKYIGSWSAAEGKRFREAVRELDQVDGGFWK